MKLFAKLRGKNVYFTALKITDETDKMFKVMKEAFGQNFKSTEK